MLYWIGNSDDAGGPVRNSHEDHGLAFRLKIVRLRFEIFQIGDAVSAQERGLTDHNWGATFSRDHSSTRRRREVFDVFQLELSVTR